MRHIFMFIFVFFSIFCCIHVVKAETEKLIPITVGDLERNRTLTARERLEFISEFYLKNKKNGATDEDILNELLKLVEFTPEDVENIDLIKKQYQIMKAKIKSAINEINISILEENPGRTDMIIDFDDINTWKNIKNINMGDYKLEDYLKVFKGNSYFSQSVFSESMSAVLASCAHRDQSEVRMSFILFPKEGYTFVVQEEGKKADGIQIDFSGSENLTFDSVHFPMQTSMLLNGQTVFGYKGKTYLPFKAELEDASKEGIVRAKVTVNTCKDDVCQKEVLPEMVYQTEKSTLEGAFCPNIVQMLNSAPSSQSADIKLKEAFFKKDKTGRVNFVASLKLPFFSYPEISLLIRNEQGLHFEKPFLSKKGKEILVDALLLNPQELKESANITLDAVFPNAGAEFNLMVPIKKASENKNFSFFSFSIFDFISSFFMGLKFFVLTPLLTAFLMLLNQAMLVHGKHVEKTLSFYDGMTKMFFIWFGIFFIFTGIFGSFSGFQVILWGKQFNSPLMNFIFVLIFLSAALHCRKIFDDIALETFESRCSRLFSLMNSENVWESAGIIVGIVTGALLLITPMTHLYYQAYDILSRSFVLYSIAFGAGIAAPFWFISLISEEAEEFEENRNAQRLAGWIIPVPLYIQAMILLLSIGSLAGLNILWASLILLGIVGAIALKAEHLKKKSIMAGILISVCFIPLFPTGKDMNNRESMEFDEALLHQQIAEGKSVYLNVSESFCMSCIWNRFLVVNKGAKEEIEKGELIVMRINYNNPFLTKLFPSDVTRSLPMNIVFSPRYPAGKVVDADFGLWSVTRNMEEVLPIKKYETDPQMWLGRKRRGPGDEDKD